MFTQAPARGAGNQSTRKLSRRGAAAARTAALCAVAFAVLGPAQALAEPAWLAPEVLSAPGGSGDDPQVATDEQGNIYAAWEVITGGDRVIKAAMRPAGGSWPAPDSVASLSSPGKHSRATKIAADAAGNAVAVWEEREQAGAAEALIKAAFRPAGGDWPSPDAAATLSAPGEKVTSPRVAIDDLGNAHAVWRNIVKDEPGEEVRSRIEASMRPATGDWDPESSVLSERGPGAGTATAPRVDVDQDGEAVAVWLLDIDGNAQVVHNVVQAATRQSGRGWREAERISQEEEGVDEPSAADPQVAMNASGDAVVAWTAETTPRASVKVAERDTRRGNNWQDPKSIYDGTTGELAPSAPRVAIDAAGNMTAVWVAEEGSGQTTIQSSSRPVDGGWDRPQAISGRDASKPRIVTDPAGNAVTTWIHNDSLVDVVQAVTRPAGGDWNSQPTTISDQNVQSAAELAIDDEGNAVGIWARNAGESAIEAAGYDAAPPRLDDLSVPSSGTAGQSLAFSVSPFDVWTPSDRIAVRWDFGDGTGATGAAVSHAYASTGSYAAQVTATDAVGNTSSQSQGITVAGNEQPPPAAPAAGLVPTRVAQIGKPSLRLRCLRGKRLVSCRGQARRAKRRLVVSFRSTVAAEVRLRVTQRVRRHGRTRTVTVLRRTLAASAGRNRHRVPIKVRSARGLTATLTIVGAGSSRTVRVTG